VGADWLAAGARRAIPASRLMQYQLENANFFNQLESALGDQYRVTVKTVELHQLLALFTSLLQKIKEK
jgi:hypothetical protein